MGSLQTRPTRRGKQVRASAVLKLDTDRRKDELKPDAAPSPQ
jgi:hypothetical protein